MTEGNRVLAYLRKISAVLHFGALCWDCVCAVHNESIW